MTSEQFFSRVDKSSADRCWIWTMAKDPKGYGWLGFKGRADRAHRVAWILSRGPIPPGKCVLHKCDNPPCCNPEHLFIGTRIDNNRDRHEKGRSRGGILSGGENPMSKLNVDTVLAVRSCPGKYREVAVKFGISRQHVAQIKNRLRWAHLE